MHANYDTREENERRKKNCTKIRIERTTTEYLLFNANRKIKNQEKQNGKYRVEEFKFCKMGCFIACEDIIKQMIVWL